MVLGFKVVNRSKEAVFCAITSKTNPSGDAGWFELQPGGGDTWSRAGWEDVSFRNRDSSKKKALWINRGSPAVVNFDGFDVDLDIQNNFQPPGTAGGFLVSNHSAKPIYCFISTTSGGNGDWFKIPPGGNDTWARSGWETIAFKDENDQERKGVYVTNNGSKATVDFHGFDTDIAVHIPPGTILAEHYSEAVAIADRSFIAQSSRATNPGGFTASIYKVDTLERLGQGRTVSLNSHNQIYTLALLINHLKYGLAEPAVVVSVNDVWVKVAAYSCEFDTIVLLGFPTKAVDLVAPGKQRPVVGTRLIVVSQFTYRDADKQGVQGDITMGPRTLNKWYNFQPLVAPFVAPGDEAPLWQQRIASVNEFLWGRVWEEWLAWKVRHGENYFRSGVPSKIRLIATNHN